MNTVSLIGIGLLFAFLFFLQRIVYVRLWAKNLKVSINFSKEHIFEGERGELREVVENRKRLPLPVLKVKFKTDRNLIFGKIKGSTTTDQFYRNDIFRVGGGERVTRNLKFTGGKRGYYTIDAMSLVASDLFLSADMTGDLPVQTHLYVYPKPFDSQEFRRSLTQLNGEVLSKRHQIEDPFEFRGIREYQPFDDMKTINWKATAKTGDLKVNQKGFTSLKSIRVFFNVQDDGVLKKEDAVEASLRISAGLAQFFLNQGIEVACCGNAVDCLTEKPMVVEAQAGAGQLEGILRNLARLDLTKPIVDFSQTFEERLFKQSKGTITCFVAPNQFDEFVDLVRRYQAAGHDYMWFYPVQESKDPELPAGLEGHIQVIHY